MLDAEKCKSAMEISTTMPGMMPGLLFDSHMSGQGGQTPSMTPWQAGSTPNYLNAWTPGGMTPSAGAAFSPSSHSEGFSPSYSPGWSPGPSPAFTPGSGGYSHFSPQYSSASPLAGPTSLTYSPSSPGTLPSRPVTHRHPPAILSLLQDIFQLAHPIPLQAPPTHQPVCLIALPPPATAPLCHHTRQPLQATALLL